jgi:O-antigen/teichoic acid export membrane protein
MSIRRHAGYNLVGSILPIALSLLTVPLYLKLVGAERYGVLAIAWLFLGYFGLFDLGLGRATSFRIASLAKAAPEDRASAFWSALSVNVGMGLIGGLVLWGAGTLFFGTVFKLSDSLRSEAVTAIPLLALAVPIATLSGVLTGALQGRERFLQTNTVSVLSTGLFQLAPLAVAAWIGPSLPNVLTAAIGARLVGLGVLAFFCWRELLSGVSGRPRRDEIRTLLGYGGWVSLTSLFGPFLVIVDRFAIGTLLGPAAVATYTIPYQLAQRMAIVPSAITNALFPRMSSSEPVQRAALAEKASLVVVCVMTFLALPAIVLVEPFFNIWIGRDMASDAAPIARILIIGFWCNALALVPFMSLQASGRPDLVTKLILAQIPPYLGSLYIMASQFGLTGCAIVFSARCFVDYIIQSVCSFRRVYHPSIVLANASILGLASVTAGVIDEYTFSWWACAVLLGAACTGLSAWMLPRDIRSALVERARRLIRREP